MVEASDHGYVLHTRRIHVTQYNVVRVGYIFYRTSNYVQTTQNVQEESCNGSSQLFYSSLQHVMRAHNSGRSLQHVMRAHSSGRVT
jgi:hypothetical protein